MITLVRLRPRAEHALRYLAIEGPSALAAVGHAVYGHDRSGAATELWLSRLRGHGLTTLADDGRWRATSAGRDLIRALWEDAGIDGALPPLHGDGAFRVDVAGWIPLP